jgi:hypothetical protein
MPPPPLPGRITFPEQPSKSDLIVMGKGKEPEGQQVPLTSSDDMGIPRPDSPVLGAHTSPA